MKLKAKFVDLTLDDIWWWPESGFPLGDYGGISGLKRFAVPPRISGEADPLAVGSPEKAATYAYALNLASRISGYAMSARITVTADILAAKEALFPVQVADGLHGSVVGKIINGPELARGIDFDVLEDGSGISWVDFDMDGVVAEGDVLQFIYKGIRGLA
jgi:hypothetical protein